jgi:hypothetical protein
MKIARFTPQILLLAMLIWVAGCATPDPLAGWRSLGSDPNSVNKAIQVDYQDYIQKLPPEPRDYGSENSFFEDGAGQHAVRIFIPTHRTSWLYILIYDKENKRIKVIKHKYLNGGYLTQFSNLKQL